ncbi:hypothetical protein ACVU7I_10945 [Patulibacter sp. S7RM1-6]
MIQLPQLQESLLLANDRLVARAQRRARRLRLGLFTSVAVMGVSGAAVGAGALWGPILGHEDGNRPTPSATPVPQAQAARLSVLRRPQTNADRGAVAQAALRDADRRYRGVRTGAVRTLTSGGPASLVLVPVADQRAPTTAAGRLGQPTTRDALCLYIRMSASARTSKCFSGADVERGTVVVGANDTTAGLVPDGVDAVRVPLRAGGTRDVPVRENAFVTTTGDIDPTTPRGTWIVDGRATSRSTTLLVLVPPADGRATPAG